MMFPSKACWAIAAPLTSDRHRDEAESKPLPVNPILHSCDLPVTSEWICFENEEPLPIRVRLKGNRKEQPQPRPNKMP